MRCHMCSYTRARQCAGDSDESAHTITCVSGLKCVKTHRTKYSVYFYLMFSSLLPGIALMRRWSTPKTEPSTVTPSLLCALYKYDNVSQFSFHLQLNSLARAARHYLPYGDLNSTLYAKCWDAFRRQKLLFKFKSKTNRLTDTKISINFQANFNDRAFKPHINHNFVLFWYDDKVSAWACSLHTFLPSKWKESSENISQKRIWKFTNHNYSVFGVCCLMSTQSERSLYVLGISLKFVTIPCFDRTLSKM